MHHYCSLKWLPITIMPLISQALNTQYEYPYTCPAIFVGSLLADLHLQISPKMHKGGHGRFSCS